MYHYYNYGWKINYPEIGYQEFCQLIEQENRDPNKALGQSINNAVYLAFAFWVVYVSLSINIIRISVTIISIVRTSSISIIRISISITIISIMIMIIIIAAQTFGKFKLSENMMNHHIRNTYW